MNKKIFLAALLMPFFMLTANAQNTIKVKKAEGKVTEYNVKDIKNITFKGEQMTITTTTGSVSEPVDSVDKVEVNDPYNGHDYVDLGLPSGTKWATCNVGAKSPEDYGLYFAWGETKPKDTYTIENSQNFGYTVDEMEAKGITKDNKLTPEYDAVTANWGGKWRLPTFDDVLELYYSCMFSSEWTTVNGVKGRTLTGPNGNSIFLPAGGYYDKDDTVPETVGDQCGFWTSTIENAWLSGDYGEKTWAQCLVVFPNDFGNATSMVYIGRPIRGVAK